MIKEIDTTPEHCVRTGLIGRGLDAEETPKSLEVGLEFKQESKSWENIPGRGSSRTKEGRQRSTRHAGEARKTN